MINVGMIGCGYWGPKLVRNFSQYKETNMVICSDLRGDRLEAIAESYPGIKTTKDHREILMDSSIDGVIIATPVETHYRLAKEAFEAGKHVLLEKPLTATFEEGEELVNIAKEKNKILMVDHTFLYMAETERMKELIQSGELGEVYTLDMQRVSLGLFQKKINVIQDLAPHDISILNYILNSKPSAVHTTVAYACAGRGRGVEDTAHLIFDYPNANIVTLHVSWIHPERKRLLTITGSKKMAICDFIKGEHPIEIYNKGVANYQPQSPDTVVDIQYKDHEILRPAIVGKEALMEVVKEFATSIKESRKPKTSGEDGLEVVRVLDAALQSLKKDKKIKIVY